MWCYTGLVLVLLLACSWPSLRSVYLSISLVSPVHPSAGQRVIQSTASGIQLSGQVNPGSVMMDLQSRWRGDEGVEMTVEYGVWSQ
jgi:hypothetical protein